MRDFDKPITREWLLETGWFAEGVNFLGYYLPTWDDNCARCTLYIDKAYPSVSPNQTGWCVGIDQESAGEVDHVLLTCKVFETRGDLIRLMLALGVEEATVVG